MPKVDTDVGALVGQIKSIRSMSTVDDGGGELVRRAPITRPAFVPLPLRHADWRGKLRIEIREGRVLELQRRPVRFCLPKPPSANQDNYSTIWTPDELRC